MLAECFRNALLLADRHKLTSIAFPAISTGVFGYPLQDAAAVAMKAVSDTLAELNSVRLVRFVLFSDEDRKVFEQALELESGLSGR